LCREKYLTLLSNLPTSKIHGFVDFKGRKKFYFGAIHVRIIIANFKASSYTDVGGEWGDRWTHTGRQAFINRSLYKIFKLLPRFAQDGQWGWMKNPNIALSPSKTFTFYNQERQGSKSLKILNQNAKFSIKYENKKRKALLGIWIRSSNFIKCWEASMQKSYFYSGFFNKEGLLFLTCIRSTWKVYWGN